PENGKQNLFRPDVAGDQAVLIAKYVVVGLGEFLRQLDGNGGVPAAVGEEDLKAIPNLLLRLPHPPEFPDHSGGLSARPAFADQHLGGGFPDELVFHDLLELCLDPTGRNAGEELTQFAGFVLLTQPTGTVFPAGESLSAAEVPNQQGGG